MSGEKWEVLAADFPPSLNTEDDVAALEPNETPECYGVDTQSEGFLKTASILTGSAREVVTNTFPSRDDGIVKSWEYYYNRSWQDTGSTLKYTAPQYDDLDIRQGLGELAVDTNIVTFMPALGSSMIVATAKGSHLINNVVDQRGFYTLDQFKQEMFATTATHVLVLDGQPFASNAKGLFSFNGSAVKEWTAKVRNSLGPFTAKAITADYSKKLIIGTTTYICDTTNGKLFDYSTSGFRFTSRALVQPRGMDAFTVDMIGIVFEKTTAATDLEVISWQTKLEDNDWQDEEDIEISKEEDQATRVTKEVLGTNRTGHKFQVRLTSLPASIKIRQIQVNALNLAKKVISE